MAAKDSRFTIVESVTSGHIPDADVRSKIVPGDIILSSNGNVTQPYVKDSNENHAVIYLGADPFGGAVFVFRAKRADRIKLVFWDGTGLCLYAKRLEDGEFRWPKVHDGVMRLSSAQLGALLEGLDWRRVHQARRTRTPVAAG